MYNETKSPHRPDDFFSADKKSAANKQSDCCIAFLCAMLISPLTLLTGQKLYGKDTAMKSLWPFMVSQRMQPNSGYLLSTL